MRKILLVIAGALTSAMTIAHAAPNQTPTSIGGVAVPTTPNSNQVMSNDAFRNTVKQYGTDATNRINQSVQQTVKSSTGTGPTATGSASSSSTSAPSQQQPANAQQEQTEQENYDITQQGRPASNKPTGTQRSPASQQPASAPQTYTGFGSGNQDNQNNSGGTNSKKSSGWNMGY
ncbi:MAG TPA: hypothetical protein VL360_03700 [Gammaproteobacteria bacterium]|jgi:hypothetical protein|nr:hypothetical protein [Gammaproteobacteria bacterium]